jgi:SlyX protein
MSRFTARAAPAQQRGLGKPAHWDVLGRMSEQTHLEEKIAHLTRTVDDLSDIVARHDDDISRLLHRVQMLMEREASREMDTGSSVPVADQRPPHY